MAPIQKKVHINVDLGEGYGNFKAGPDDELIPLIDHANIACGVSDDIQSNLSQHTNGLIISITNRDSSTPAIRSSCKKPS